MSKLVLWGHSLKEYREMFDLRDDDLAGSILECGCGPTAFNDEMLQHNHPILSCDPLFSLDHDQLQHKVEASTLDVLSTIQANPEQYLAEGGVSFADLQTSREQGLSQFFQDYAQGRAEGRYLAVDFPCLPFDDFRFKLALSSHQLFVNSLQQDLSYHLQSILEMARVAHEVRLFPLTDSQGNPSELLGPVMLSLQQNNLGVEVRQVPFRCQTNANAMLRVWAQECVVD